MEVDIANKIVKIIADTSKITDIYDAINFCIFLQKDPFTQICAK
jgi:hypothetical protein